MRGFNFPERIFLIEIVAGWGAKEPVSSCREFIQYGERFEPLGRFEPSEILEAEIVLAQLIVDAAWGNAEKARRLRLITGRLAQGRFEKKSFAPFQRS